jgi:hypothetical protein
MASGDNSWPMIDVLRETGVGGWLYRWMGSGCGVTDNCDGEEQMLLDWTRIRKSEVQVNTAVDEH